MSAANDCCGDSVNCTRTEERSCTLARQYDTRAAPRRRAKADAGEEQPIFLKKAFTMISSCPKEIGNLFSAVIE